MCLCAVGPGISVRQCLPGGRGAKSGLYLIPLLTGDALSNLPKLSHKLASGWGRACASSHPHLFPLGPGLPLFFSFFSFLASCNIWISWARDQIRIPVVTQATLVAMPDPPTLCARPGIEPASQCVRVAPPIQLWHSGNSPGLPLYASVYGSSLQKISDMKFVRES